MGNEILKVNNLNVYFENKQILNNINLTFDENTISCIIGSSGCGKTTLLKTINNSIAFDKELKIDGTIYFEGKNISEIVETNLRKQIAMLMQMPIVFPFSIYKNLEYVLDYHFKLSKKEKNDRIIDILKKVQLYDEIQNDLKMSAEKLSGGQKQRLCLARALLTEPKIILLDEPCSALDVYNTMCIENLLLNLKKELTIIIVTHNIQEAKRINDRIIFMKDGKVIEDSKDFFDNMITEEAKAFINVN